MGKVANKMVFAIDMLNSVMECRKNDIMSGDTLTYGSSRIDFLKHIKPIIEYDLNKKQVQFYQKEVDIKRFYSLLLALDSQAQVLQDGGLGVNVQKDFDKLCANVKINNSVKNSPQWKILKKYISILHHLYVDKYKELAAAHINGVFDRIKNFVKIKPSKFGEGETVSIETYNQMLYVIKQDAQLVEPFYPEETEQIVDICNQLFLIKVEENEK